MDSLELVDAGVRDVGISVVDERRTLEIAERRTSPICRGRAHPGTRRRRTQRRIVRLRVQRATEKPMRAAVDSRAACVDPTAAVPTVPPTDVARELH
jgi:hypothetical protein